MNGQVYEPELGRFVSADPLVPDLNNLQAFNRFGYVLNRPLALTDPSGFCDDPTGTKTSGGNAKPECEEPPPTDPPPSPPGDAPGGDLPTILDDLPVGGVAIPFTPPPPTLSGFLISGRLAIGQVPGGPPPGSGEQSATEQPAQLEPIQIVAYVPKVLNPNNYPLSPQMLRILQVFANMIGHSITVTGGNRECNAMTANMGAGCSSPHMLGIAADIKVEGLSLLEVAWLAFDSGLFTGVGWYQEGYFGGPGVGPHVHVDFRVARPLVGTYGFTALPVFVFGYTSNGTPVTQLPPLIPRGGP